MSNMLTDLLYFDLDKEALCIMFSSLAKTNHLADVMISLLMKKIERFGEEAETTAVVE